MPGASPTAVELPVIADADTGYGNELNVVRTVREYEEAGVAGIHIEDQGFPKKCGHLDDKEIVPREDWLAKIRAAASARAAAATSRSSRAPTRAPSPGSTRRSRAPTRRSRPAPTWCFVEAPQTLEEVAAVPRLVQRAVPAQCRARRQDAGPRPRRGRADGLQARDRAGPADQERRRHLREDARPNWPRPAATRSRCAK